MAGALLFKDPTLQVAQHNNVLIIRWSDAPGEQHLRECGRIGRAAARQYPGGVGLLNLLGGGTPKFTEGVRDEAMKLNRDQNLFSAGVANIVLVSGFAGVAVRAFLNTTALLGRSVRPTKTFATVLEGAEWLVPRLGADGQKWTPADMVAVAKPLSV